MSLDYIASLKKNRKRTETLDFSLGDDSDENINDIILRGDTHPL